MNLKFFIAIFLTGLLAVALGLIMPYWSVAVAGFVVALAVRLRPGYAFLGGFLGIFLAWMIIAFVRDGANEGILSHRIALILPLGGSSFVLILLSALIGAVLGGFGALTGSYLARSLRLQND